MCCFNPRAREGRDGGKWLIIHSAHVSIHAPARGATTSCCVNGRFARMFQSTRPRGARRCSTQCSKQRVTFQSTRPRGARLPLRRIIRIAKIMFQSTRPRGARPCGAACRIHHQRFQSTRPRGARRQSRGKICRQFSFQSTRPRGARLNPPAPVSNLVGVFQSTRPRGARP